MLSSEEGIAELRKMPGERLPERLKAEAFIFFVFRRGCPENKSENISVKIN
ncbi:hypothetical protein Sgly_1118 [Syntrophobotulus glycolicus DSM 8271]|uniref:Uncharacterized protein n=1 Tax=Syntrophobotulus glycolicus (strain DSM 8271 / FlGlyR) TaxID=645991 RepID=F0SU60_SYNGF|nr:hypothetical protein Sgly_1118 [Syntrophobotulus glycolicus DSM 8271]